MVNGFCFTLPTRSPCNDLLCEDIIPYLCSLHSFHGFDTVFVPPKQQFSSVYPQLRHLNSNKGYVDRQKAVDELYKRLSQLSFVKFIPNGVWSYSETRKTILEKLIYEFLESVDSIRAGNDLVDLRLRNIVSMYQLWVASCELQAEMIYSSPLRFQIAVGLIDSRGGIRNHKELRPLRISLKRWFFSHYANFNVKLPMIIGEMHEDLQEPLFVKEFRKTRHLLSLPELMKKASVFRDKLLVKSKKYSYRITSFVKKNLRGIAVSFTSCAITVATKNLYSLSPALLEIPNLTMHFCDDIFHRAFDSHLVLEAPPYFTQLPPTDWILRDAQDSFLKDLTSHREPS